MSDFRFNIHPFPRIAVYPTGWGDDLTFAEIMEDCSFLAATLMRKRHIDNKDIPDAFVGNLPNLSFQLKLEKLSPSGFHFY
ncbi:MAG: hypothetical protein KC708_23785 [Anaerolineae bacterium]|nr:hypothetical protein [Anaerolineae bacterium]